MQAAHLHAATGAAVEIDLCPGCRLVWFDDREALQLSGLGWIGLLTRLQHDAAAPNAWSGERLGCVKCGQTLVARHNQTKYGRFLVHACARGHGTLRSEAMLLAERGMVREPSTAERAALSAEHARWACLNCGAPADDERNCRWCHTPLLMIDLPRLATSLRPEAGGRELPRSGEVQAWACHGCGQVLDPTRENQCAQCHHPVLARLPEHLQPVLQALEREWSTWLAEARRQLPADPTPRAARRKADWEKPGRRAAATRTAAPRDPWPVNLWFGCGVLLAALWGWWLW